MGRVNTLKFSESGVRGIVGEGLTPRLVTELGAAFGFYQGGGRIVVGRDTRATGAMFEDALYSMKGAKAAGFHVYAIEDFFARPDKPEILRLCDRYFTDYRELMNGEDTIK